MFNPSDFAKSIIRTIVPYFVATLLTFAWIHKVIDWLGVTDETAQQALTQGVTLALTFGYYVVVRLCEPKHPNAGLLLGARGRVTYKPA